MAQAPDGVHLMTDQQSRGLCGNVGQCRIFSLDERVFYGAVDVRVCWQLLTRAGWDVGDANKSRLAGPSCYQLLQV